MNRPFSTARLDFGRVAMRTKRCASSGARSWGGVDDGHGRFVLHLSSAGGALRVFRHAQVVEDQAHVAVELAHFLGDAFKRLGLDEADGEASCAISRIGNHPISSPLIHPIMDASRPERSGQPPPSTTISISPTSRRPTSSNVTPLTKKAASLHTTSPTASPADRPSRPTRNASSRSTADTGVSKIAATTSSIGTTTKTAAVSAPATAGEHDPIQRGLVAFDREMVMPVALGNEVIGQLALGQQSIGRDVLGGEVDGCQQRDGHLDFVWYAQVLRCRRLWAGYRLFLGVAGPALMPDDAHDVSLCPLFINRVAHRLAIDRESRVFLAIGLIPAL